VGVPLPLGGRPLDLVSKLGLTTTSTARPRELYIDAFRGLMALVMVQGHLCDSLLDPVIRAEPWYVWQQIFHGSTAPGFLFASGFVAGLPRAPLSLAASIRRARRLLFVLAVGYFIHLPYFSFWKTMNEASPRQREILFSCDALQVIAVTQLFVLGLQWVAGRYWTRAGAVVALAVIAAAPGVWASGFAERLPEAVAPYLDRSTGSRFPIFPYSAFVLAGTLAGALLGRVEPRTRHVRALVGGVGLIGLGAVLAVALEGWVDLTEEMLEQNVLGWDGRIRLELVAPMAIVALTTLELATGVSDQIGKRLRLPLRRDTPLVDGLPRAGNPFAEPKTPILQHFHHRCWETAQGSRSFLSG